MGDVLTFYKIEVIKRRRKLVDLAEALKLDYSKFSRIINGYDRIPESFDANVQAVLHLWDEQDNRKKAA